MTYRPNQDASQPPKDLEAILSTLDELRLNAVRRTYLKARGRHRINGLVAWEHSKEINEKD